MLQALDEAAVGHWCRTAVEALSEARGRLDELNVFPVPDGDTGTNLLLTAQAALAALERDGDRTTEPAWSVLSRGAVLGARGNSGTILAQLLRGLADQLAGQPAADGPAFAAALRKAAETAYTAVADPEEGTFLSVARGAAETAVAEVDAGRRALADVVTRPRTAPGPPWTAPPASWPPCARPGWSTPAAPGSASSSTPWSPP